MTTNSESQYDSFDILSINCIVVISLAYRNKTSHHSVTFYMFAILTLIVKSMSNFMPNNRCNSAKVQIPVNVTVPTELSTIDKHQ